MIQRLQSLYLLVGAALIVAFLAFAGSWWEVIAEVYSWMPVVVIALGVAIAILGFGAIFLYGDREKQLRMVNISIWLDLILALVMASLILSASLRATVTLDAARLQVLYVFASFPIAAYVFLRMAKRGIQKDIATVRSMDRLR